MVYHILLYLALCTLPSISLHTAEETAAEVDTPTLDETDDTTETDTDTDDIDALIGEDDTDELLSDDELSEDDPLLADDPLLDDPLLDATEEAEDDLLSLGEDDDEEEEPGTYSPTDGAQIVLPVLGQFIFSPTGEAIKNNTASAIGQERKKQSDENTNKTYPIQKIMLKKLRGSITEKGNLHIDGISVINNTEGKITKTTYDAENQELVLTLSYKKPFTFFILPDVEVSITTFTLTLSPTTQELAAQKSVFTKDKEESKLTFGIETTRNSGGLLSIADPVPLSSIIPEAKGNKDVEGIMLSDVTISFINPLAPELVAETGSVMPTITINATAQLSHIKLSKKAHLSDSDTTITLSGPTISIDALGNTPIQLDDDVILNSPTFSLDMMKGSPLPDIGIGGTLSCELPVVGKVNIPVHGTKTAGGFELRGKFGKTIDFGPVSFGNPEIVVARESSGATDPNAAADKSFRLELRGNFNLFGFKILPILRFVKPSLSDLATGGPGMQRVVEFSGEINGGKPIKPFDDIPGLNAIPGLKDFVMDKAQLGVDTTKKTFIGGTSTLLGVATQAKVLTSGAKGVMASTLKPWKISDSIPSLAGSILDSIVFETANFGFVAAKYFDAAAGMMMEPGTNIFGTIETTHGIFESLRKMLGGALPKKVTVGIILRPNPRDIKLQVALPLDINLSSRASIHNLIFEVGLAPSFALMVSLRFITGKNDPPLLFTARIEFQIPFFAVSGTMQGMWHKPFGIPGIKVGDVALEIQQPYAPLPPIGFGIAGTLGIGDFLAKAAVKIGPTDLILLAEVNKWPLFMLPSFLNMVGLDLGPLEIIKAIDLCLYDAKFKFAPAGGQIGTLYFDPGISASGKLIINIPYIIKAKLEAGFNLNWIGGFKLYAMMPKFNIGPLKITGKGKDKKWNTADDGPIFYAALSLMEQRIYISALAELFNSSAELEVDIGLLHLRFKMIMKLLGFLDAHIAGETYHKGWRIGFKTIGTINIGSQSGITLFGDINTLGCNFAGKYDKLTLRDIAALCKIPNDLIPEFGFTNLEFYVRAQG